MPRYSWEFKKRSQNTPTGPADSLGPEERSNFSAAMLQFLPPFFGLTQEEAKELAGITSTREYARGSTVFDEGSVGDSLFAVIRGRVDIKMKAIGADQETIASLPEGSVLGEMALLTQQSRSATAIAADDVQLLTMSVQDFQQLIDRECIAAYKVIHNLGRIVAERLNAVNEQLAALNPHTTQRREDISELKKKLFNEWTF